MIKKSSKHEFNYVTTTIISFKKGVVLFCNILRMNLIIFE